MLYSVCIYMYRSYSPPGRSSPTSGRSSRAWTPVAFTIMKIRSGGKSNDNDNNTKEILIYVIS